MGKLAVGSGDCLPLIFNCLTLLKDKVRLERVCKRFRKHARSFSAWSNVTSLIFKDWERKSKSRSLQHAVEMVVSYMSILNEENSQCWKYLKLALKAAVLGKADWDKLCAALVIDHKCKVEAKAEASFLICFHGKELACIELINIGAPLSWLYFLRRCLCCWLLPFVAWLLSFVTWLDLKMMRC